MDIHKIGSPDPPNFSPLLSPPNARDIRQAHGGDNYEGYEVAAENVMQTRPNRDS
jgi:hypothetical protein